ncbi:MAG TPA: TolC family protein [Chitinophagaceae bacterium]|nr:TolC family protein [Chitinophagaceae bacterium]
MMLRCFTGLAFGFIVNTCLAQTTPEKWDLQRCVTYALENNISVRQSDLQTKYSELSLVQNKATRLPTLNFNSSVGYRYGRSENPTTGVLEDNNFLNLGMQMQSQVTLFNWFSIKHTIEASRINWEADKEQVKKVQNDIALNVAVAYLQVLLSREQVNLTKVQAEQTGSQLAITRKRVDAGSLPELSAAELEAQLARDSSALVTAEAAVQQFILQLKALLNLDAGMPFDVATPPVGLIPVESLADLQPEAVYASAMANLPQQKVLQLRLQSALRSVAAARGAMYPTISAFGGLGSSYVNIKVPDGQFVSRAPTEAVVTISGTDYTVFAPSFIQTGERTIPLGRQLRNNFGQSIGIGLNIPIFNGRMARSSWDRSKLDVKQWELTKEQDSQTLKQDIYKAYTDAMAAMQKFNAGKKTVETSQKAYDFASKRFEVGLLSTLELVTSQNNLQRAKIDLLYAQYDYVFKMKLLEFYKGQGIKL